MIEIDRFSLGEYFPKRPRDAHKNTFGHLLIIAGSAGMAGAAAICARAAVRSGAGLVSVACPAEIVPIIQTLEPCAMCLPIKSFEGAITAEGISFALRGKTAVAIGPGLSRLADPEAIRLVLKSGLPAVIDADAINIISAEPELMALLNCDHIITPHPGEAARLLGRPVSACEADAVALREATRAVALLKGAESFIAGRAIYKSSSGTVGMAKGGSGDALTGMAGAFLAQGFPAERAAWLASELHGLAGEIAYEKLGEISMTPMDLTDCIAEAFKKYVL